MLLIEQRSHTQPMPSNDDYKRKKGKDKKKETFKKYGKNTQRGLRHKLDQCTKNVQVPSGEVVR